MICHRTDCDRPANYTVIPMTPEPDPGVWNDDGDPYPTCHIHLHSMIGWMSEHRQHFHVTKATAQ